MISFGQGLFDLVLKSSDFGVLDVGRVSELFDLVMTGHRENFIWRFQTEGLGFRAHGLRFKV